MAHIQTQAEWEQDMCIKILSVIQDELYLDFRYLDMALSALIPVPGEQIVTFATDGISLKFSTEQILRLYRKNPLFLNRAYLHSVLHCLFRHLWMRKTRQVPIWNIACDIAVEWVIDHLDKPSVKRALSWNRLHYYEHLKEFNIPVSAAGIYRDLLFLSKEELETLNAEFHTDDHRFWPKEESGKSPSNDRVGKNWEDIARRSEKELSMRGQESAQGSQSLKTQIEEGRHRRNYREFLRKFTVLKEELHLNDDEFDLNYYTFGLRFYKNMPLIEPLESREVMKIHEFVIVLDTSYSTNGDLVKNFIKETFSILTERDSFFRKTKIRIIQCDNKVQSDTIIESTEDISHYLRAFELIGGGGTDFRPAFSYVNELIEEGAFSDLRGLIYFTDGKGIYPKKRMPYETAFLFLDRKESETKEVPPWAMKLFLEEEDLRSID